MDGSRGLDADGRFLVRDRRRSEAAHLRSAGRARRHRESGRESRRVDRAHVPVAQARRAGARGEARLADSRAAARPARSGSCRGAGVRSRPAAPRRDRGDSRDGAQRPPPLGRRPSRARRRRHAGRSRPGARLPARLGGPRDWRAAREDPRAAGDLLELPIELVLRRTALQYPCTPSNSYILLWPQRQVGARPRRAEPRRAVRDGLLPSAAPDVRRNSARHRVRGLLEGARPTQEGPRHHLRHRPRRRRPSRPGRDLQAGDPRARRPWLPAGSARAARAGDARGVRLVEHRARRPLPPPGAHRRGHGYGGQRAGDGLRQPRRRLGLGRRLHPRPGVREPGRVRRLPAERPGRGRRRRHPQHRVAGRHGADRQGVARRAARRS